MLSRAGGIVSVIVIAVSVLLSGLTLTAWVDSHATLQEFDVVFDDVVQQSDPQQFSISLQFVNAGELKTEMESAAVALYYDGRLIAAGNWFPQDFYIPPGQTDGKSMRLESNLDPEKLTGLDREDRWHVRIRMRVTHPVREDAIVLQRQRYLSR